ncbi:MAG: metal-dependent hydrolase [Elusimicrobiota bacterium]
MDNITHTLIGVTLSNAGLKTKFGKGTTWILAIASNLPDLDILGGLFISGESHFYRRMLTHSVFGMPIIAFLAALIFKKIFKEQKFSVILGLVLGGMAIHLFFDFVNSYGVVPFYPFSKERYELAWIFIIDLILLSILIFPFILSKIKTKWTSLEFLSTVSIRSVMAYVMICGLFHAMSKQMFSKWLTNQGQKTDFQYIFPEPFGPHRFRGVSRTDQEYKSSLIEVLNNKVTPAFKTKTEFKNSDIERILKSAEGQKLNRFFKAPAWELDQEKSSKDGLTRIWKASDLRFTSILLNRGNFFSYRFEVTDNSVNYLGRN